MTAARNRSAAIRLALVTTSAAATIPAGLDITDTTVDLLVIGSGTGLAAALSGHESGLNVLVVEKASDVGGSTARSGGALWLPTTGLLTDKGTADTADRASTYLDAVVNGTAPTARSTGFLKHVNATVDMLGRTTPMRLFWAREYSDYHPELPGGRATGRTCECRPLNARVLGKYRDRLRGGVMEVKVPMPTTGADYKWMNLMTRVPRKGLPLIAKRLAQGVGELLDHRELLGAAHATTTGDDDGGFRQLRTVTGDDRLACGDPGGVLRGGGHLDGDLLAGGGRRGRLDGTRAHGDHRGVAVGLGLDGERATEDRVDALGAFLDLDDIDQQTRTDAGGQPAGDLLAVGVGGNQHAGRGDGLGQRGQHVHVGGHQDVVDVGRLGDVDLGRTGGREIRGQAGGGAGGAHHDGGGLTESPGRGDQLGGDLLQGTVRMLDEHKYFSHCCSAS